MKTTFDLLATKLQSQKNSQTYDAGSKDVKQLAWTRAMEQVQMTTWFQHGLIGRQSNVIIPRELSAVSHDAFSNTSALGVHKADQKHESDRQYKAQQKEYRTGDELKSAYSETGSQSNAEDVSRPQLVSVKAALGQSQSNFFDLSAKGNPAQYADTLATAGLNGGIEEPSLSEGMNAQRGHEVNFNSAVSINALINSPIGNTDKLIEGRNAMLSELAAFCRQAIDATLSPSSSLIKSSDNRQPLELRLNGTHGLTADAGVKEDAIGHDTEVQADVEIVSEYEVKAEKKLLSSSENSESVRFHSEWSDEGVRIWLGVDQLDDHKMRGLAAQVKHWVAMQSLPLAGLVCNGRSLMDVEGGKNKPSETMELRKKWDVGSSLRKSDGTDTHFLLNQYTIR